jgi:hypothetical protein
MFFPVLAGCKVSNRIVQYSTQNFDAPCVDDNRRRIAEAKNALGIMVNLSESCQLDIMISFAAF